MSGEELTQKVIARWQKEANYGDCHCDDCMRRLALLAVVEIKKLRGEI